jgi:hypothetical protein
MQCPGRGFKSNKDDLRLFDRGTLPRPSTPCVTVVLSTPANHNYPAARFAEARVAASCMPPSNLRSAASNAASSAIPTARAPATAAPVL